MDPHTVKLLLAEQKKSQEKDTISEEDEDSDWPSKQAKDESIINLIKQNDSTLFPFL